MNVVWSTWVSEPRENLKKLEMAGIRYVLNTPPQNSGCSHINYQCLSTSKGISELSQRNPALSSFIKIRSDLLIEGLSALLLHTSAVLRDHEIAFIGAHRLKGGYLMDYVVAGRQTEMLRFWNLDDRSTSGFPFPEAWLQNRYFDRYSLVNGTILRSPGLCYIPLDDVELYALKWNYYLSELPEALYVINRSERNRFLGGVARLFRYLTRKYIFGYIAKQKKT